MLCLIILVFDCVALWGCCIMAVPLSLFILTSSGYSTIFLGWDFTKVLGLFISKSFLLAGNVFIPWVVHGDCPFIYKLLNLIFSF